MNVCYENPSPFHVALVEPEIPPNTGNIARTCLATFTPLHLVGQLGFRTDRRAVMRAGLDYWYDTEIHYHRSLDDLSLQLPASRLLFIETDAPQVYTEFQFAPGDVLVLGRETKGLPPELLEKNRERCLSVPMPNVRVRSLNLATTAGIVLYEALRQLKAASCK
ncbi:MAG: tRNA (cytidine(34)-2'-O)-methyltransferase, partial [Blastocatellia bacterium]|nr:tRNA (cytidine(34)-2'-O)-methyltransferase [Blastocatellia bacterium]